MSATVQLVEKNGAGPSVTDKTSGTIRHKDADDAAVNTANPLKLPGGGSFWSYEKWLRFKVTGGTYTEIDNVSVYTDGASAWTGVNLWWKAVTAYAAPAKGTASAGYANAFAYTSGSPLTLGAGPYSGTGEFGDHLVSLMEVTAGAVGGMLAGETVTIGWDEI